MLTRTPLFKYAASCGPAGMSDQAPVLFKGDWEASVAAAARCGFDAVELHLRSPEDLDLKRLKDCCQNYGIAVSAISTGMAYLIDNLSLIDPDEHGRLAAIRRLAEFIALASALDSAVIIGYMRGNIPAPEMYDVCERRLVDALKILASEAASQKVRVVIEAINKYEVNYLTTVPEVTDLVKRVGSEWIQVHADTFHMHIEENCVEESLRYAGSRIGYMHFVDNNRKIPGRGQVDFHKVFAALAEIGYNGYLSLEYLPGRDAIQSAKEGLQYLKSVEVAVSSR